MPPLIDDENQGDDQWLKKEDDSPLTLQQVEALHTQTFLAIRQHLINVQQLARVDRLEEAERQLQHTVDSALRNVSSGDLLRRLLSRVPKDKNNYDKNKNNEELSAADTSMIYLDNSKILTNPNTQSALIALRNDANILRQLIRRKIADKDFNNNLRRQEEKEQQNAVVDFELKFSNYNAEKSNFVDNSQQTLMRYKDVALNSLFQLQQQTSRLQSISSKLNDFFSALSQLSRLANRIEQLLNCNHLLFRAILCVLILFLLYIVIRKFR
ncbi:MAG: hypothetical protein MHMPM18_001736 [Marteilia pararefringens]